MDQNQFAADVRKALQASQQEIARLAAEIAKIKSKPRSWEDEIEALPGKRVPSHFVTTQDFTTSNDGQRGAGMTFKISQDGPFVMTHYPFALWKVTLPTTATNYGYWRPCWDAFLPTQQVTTDYVSISYELQDSGSQRNFQDNAMPPIFSYPDRLKALPKPALFSPNSVVMLTPTYENIAFNSSGTATTGGKLVIALIGYRIIP